MLLNFFFLKKCDTEIFSAVIDDLKQSQKKAILNSDTLQMKFGEFLNVDTILEECLHALVVKPLKNHLNKIFREDFTRSGNQNFSIIIQFYTL